MNAIDRDKGEEGDAKGNQWLLQARHDGIEMTPAQDEGAFQHWQPSAHWLIWWSKHNIRCWSFAFLSHAIILWESPDVSFCAMRLHCKGKNNLNQPLELADSLTFCHISIALSLTIVIPYVVFEWKEGKTATGLFQGHWSEPNSSFHPGKCFPNLPICHSLRSFLEIHITPNCHHQLMIHS